jgi:hypothetical protein
MPNDMCGNTSGQKCNAKGSRKEIQYQSLCTETELMWNMKRVIIPVLIRTIPGKRAIIHYKRQL